MNHRVRPRRRFSWPIGVLALAVSLTASLAAGQTAQPSADAGQAIVSPLSGGRGWAVELYGGAFVGPGATGGDAMADFPAGQSFTTGSGLPSRAVTSWFFGDGAALFNEVKADFASRFGQFYDAIVPLDAVLASAAGRPEGGSGFGIRLTRALTPRMALEIGFDRGARPLRLTDEARDAIEATRASYESAFEGLMATIPQTGARVTATVTIVEPDPPATMLSGALVYTLAARGRLEAHVVGGVGRVFGGSEALEVRLTGSYQFNIVGTFPINELDRAVMSVEAPDGATVGIAGGGLTYAVSARHGLRVDLRLQIGSNGTETSVTATPNTGSTSLNASLPSFTSPSLQFSSTPTPRSSLSGPTFAGTTFAGGGLEIRPQLTIGYYVRF